MKKIKEKINEKKLKLKKPFGIQLVENTNETYWKNLAMISKSKLLFFI